MTQRQRTAAIDAGAIYVVGASELNRVLAGRRMDAVDHLLKGLLIDYDVPCQYCGRRCVAVIGDEADVTPRQTCQRCFKDSKANEQ